MVFKYESSSFVSSVSWKRLSLEPAAVHLQVTTSLRASLASHAALRVHHPTTVRAGLSSRISV